MSYMNRKLGGFTRVSLTERLELFLVSAATTYSNVRVETIKVKNFILSNCNYIVSHVSILRRQSLKWAVLTRAVVVSCKNADCCIFREIFFLEIFQALPDRSSMFSKVCN